MRWIFLSPHLDDVVFSCGGLVWKLAQEGDQVEIWTVCAGDPPGNALSSFAQVLHNAWHVDVDVTQRRREEDIEACDLLGADPKHFMIPDCIYRRSPQTEDWLYPYEEALFSGLDPVEKPLIDVLAGQLSTELSSDDLVISPLGIGNHVDHELTRKAAQRLDHELRFYADYPYARESQNRTILQVMNNSNDWKNEGYQITRQGLRTWKEASACYRSQINMFWNGESELKEELELFSASMSGMRLWKKA